MNSISTVDISISTVISNIEENIHNYNKILQNCTLQIQSPNLDKESKESIQSNITFLKFHVEQLKNISEQLIQAKSNEASFALSSDGQMVH